MHNRFLLVLVVSVLVLHYSPSIAVDGLSNKNSVSALRDTSKDSVAAGVVKKTYDAGDPDGKYGVVRITDSASRDDYAFFYIKKDFTIDSTFVGKMVSITWIEIETGEGEDYNAFREITSIRISK